MNDGCLCEVVKALFIDKHGRKHNFNKDEYLKLKEEENSVG